jgi:hypothetical protein
MDSKEQRAREIQNSIGQVLLYDWDPIGVSNFPEARDEYDNYIEKVYRLLASKPSINEIVDLLCEIEAEWMGLTPDKERLQTVAIKLRRT